MKLERLYLLVFAVCLALSGYGSAELNIWFLEVLPALLGLAILLLTYKYFRFTGFSYTFLLLFFIMMMVGGHYTYAKVPLFDWISSWMGWERNNYDKLAHFAQGFVPALVAREYFIRKEVVNKKQWLGFIVFSISMFVSAFYEIAEWLISDFSDSGVEAFLGTQGYIWDTQSDMFMAGIGAISALVGLKKWQDKAILAIQE